jgi:hypothetical protein
MVEFVLFWAEDGRGGRDGEEACENGAPPGNVKACLY